MYSWAGREVFNKVCNVRYEGDWERVIYRIFQKRGRHDSQGTETIPSIINQSLVAFQTIISRKIPWNIKTIHNKKHKLIKYSSEFTLSSNFIFLFSYSSRAATLTRSLIPLKPLYILNRNMNSVERLVIIQLVTSTPAAGLNSKRAVVTCLTVDRSELNVMQVVEQ